MDEWIEANIFVQEGKQDEFLLKFIKPLIQRLRSEFKIIAYHFLHEPDNEVRFRVLAAPQNVEKIKGLINNAKGTLLVKDVKFPEDPYLGEKDDFGEDGWRTTCKFLEAGSDFALDLIDVNVRKGLQFNLTAFSHYFLNQNGLNILQEANFHANTANERMSIILQLSLQELGNRFMEKMNQFETRIGKLEQQRQS